MSMISGCASLIESAYPKQSLEVLEPTYSPKAIAPLVDSGYDQPTLFTEQEMYIQKAYHLGIPYGGQSQAPDVDYSDLVHL